MRGGPSSPFHRFGNSQLPCKTTLPSRRRLSGRSKKGFQLSEIRPTRRIAFNSMGSQEEN
eukprot:scaffold74219_cov53-Cyclotella_meneghiniana.AAC.3